MRKRKVWLALALCLCLAAPAAAQEDCAHDFQPVEEPATCTENGYRGYVCTLCFQTKEYEDLPKLGHDWPDWKVETEPTCRNEGLQTRSCRRCGLTQNEPLEKLAHDMVRSVVEPTCTQEGFTRLRCSYCDYSRRESVVEKLGHQYDGGTLVQQAGVDRQGKMRYVCQRCGDVRLEVIAQWGHPFVDVEEQVYYRDPVVWAYHVGITTGIDSTHFGPQLLCTRAQVVTFLWRWAGSPGTERRDCPFRDVSPDSYYYTAVMWATEKGITNGMDETHFMPEENCQRGQVVTLLYRFLGSPGVKGVTPFVDVPQESYYALSILWAYKKEITNGMDATHFMPGEPCTRGQIVTLLYRAGLKY